MTLNFPAAPADGDIYLNYVYDATEGVWNANPRQLASRFVTSATTPAEASNGDGWFNTTNGKTYIFYYDGTSGQWIESGYPVLGYQTLENLSDTTIATPTNGQVLKYNGSDWVNDTDNVGKILQVVSVVRTAVFSASVAAGGSVDITDLSITHEIQASGNKVLLLAQIGTSGNQNDARETAVAFAEGGSLINIGDAEGSRSRVGAGRSSGSFVGQGTLGASHSLTFLHAPTTGSKTYTVRAINLDGNTETVYINRTRNASDDGNNLRASSTLTLMEVAG